MKVLYFGSLDFDHVYETDPFTQSSLSDHRGFDGKGLKRSIALAKAGTEVHFVELLKDYGVHTDLLVKAGCLAGVLAMSGRGAASSILDQREVEKMLWKCEADI